MDPSEEFSNNEYTAKWEVLTRHKDISQTLNYQS